jgi:hypothetical protein
MESMRAILASLILAAAATPAAGQVPLNAFELNDLRARQDAAERAAVARSNELMSLEARLRADQAVADLQALRAPPAIPNLRYDPPLTGASKAPSKYPSMPDAALAESNRRVQAAAANRR